MEFRQATQEDLAFVRQDPFEGAVKDYPYMKIPDSNCYTAIFESEIVGVGGLVMRWEGVGLLWLMLTNNCRKNDVYGLIALHAIRDKTNELIIRNKIWRAEATIRTDFPKAVDMIEFLGFKRDCKMKKFFPDKSDAYLYSKVR